jgi:biopolymer transport protein ExbD
MNPIIAVILVVLVVCFVLSIALRRHGESDKPKADWRRTEEVFNDPSTNRVMRVWLDKAGDRHYVPEGSRHST